MNQADLHVLLVEDSLTDAHLFQHIFFLSATGDWQLVHVERLSDAIAMCQTQSFDVTILDLQLPDSEGLETIAQFNQAVPNVPIIILTMVDDEELATQAMAQGAQDYLVKDQVTMQLLRRSIRYTLGRSQILQQLRDSERATLEALDKERELNQLKTYFVSMVSHEFRNPLSVLQSMGEILFRFSDKLTEQKKEAYAMHFKSTIKQMCQLLDEVILLGKVDSGNFALALEPVDLAAFCQELQTSMQFMDNSQHPVILQLQLQSKTVQLDVSLLRHILSNLISNALKYSPSGTAVQVEVSEIEDRVSFCIRDRGIGIPDTEQSRLFQTFSRCSNVGKVQGTGLGLAIVKHCVDLYKGEIAIESAVGIGTTAIVRLPLQLEGVTSPAVR